MSLEPPSSSSLLPLIPSRFQPFSFPRLLITLLLFSTQVQALLSLLCVSSKWGRAAPWKHGLLLLSKLRTFSWEPIEPALSFWSKPGKPRPDPHSSATSPGWKTLEVVVLHFVLSRWLLVTLWTCGWRTGSRWRRHTESCQISHPSVFRFRVLSFLDSKPFLASRLWRLMLYQSKKMETRP